MFLGARSVHRPARASRTPPVASQSIITAQIRRLDSRAVLGLLAVLAQNFLGALRAQSEGQGNLSMHPQGENLYGYGPTHNTFSSGLFQARFGTHGPTIVNHGRPTYK